MGNLGLEVIGSNFEQTIGSAIPTKAALMGISDGVNTRAILGNTEGTLLASAARTATTSSPNQINYNSRGVLVYLRISVASGSGGLTVTIRSNDPVENQIVQLSNSPTAITAVGAYAFELYPGASGTAGSGNGSVVQRTAAALPRIWYVTVTHGDGTSYTYSLGYKLIN